MEQDAKPPLPVVTYANLVSFHVTVDDMLLEFWEHRQGHSTAKLTPEEVIKSKAPVARIVVPFTSARFLRDQLTLLLLQQENARKAGQ